jgi:predicted MPP superfamily phosphohydrolase
MTKPSRREALVGLGTALLGGAALARPRGEHFVLEEVEVHLSSLHPAHDGLKVAQLTDLHIGAFTPDGRLIAAMRELERLSPDLIVLTGDFVTVKSDPVERVGQLMAMLPDVPRVAVLGNHDHWTHPVEVARELERVGISVLQNQHTALRFRDETFRVIGVDDGRTKHDDPVKSFEGVPEVGSQLILTHTPSAAKRLPSRGSLCLSGHTHGGHFVVPGITEAMFNLAGEPFVRGRYEVEGNELYVSRGIGAGRGGHIPRAGAEPEATIFTLRSA